MAKKETILIRLDIDESEAKKKIIENTTAIRNYGTQNKELAKSLKEGKLTEDDYTKSLIANKQAVDSLKNENKQLELSVKASENSIEGLRSRIALLTAETNKLDMGSDKFTEAQAKLKELNDELIQAGSDRSDFRANVGNYASAVQGFEDKLIALNKTLGGLNPNTKEFKEIREEIEKTNSELSNLQNGVGSIEGKLNAFGNKLTGISSSFGNLGSSLSAAFGPVAIVAGVIAATSAIVSLKMEIDETREQVNLLTGVTGNRLDKVTAKVKATSSVFDKEFNEVLTTANTVASQFGISIEEATDLIQKGFVNGADATGNFLGDLTEFGVQFKQLGLTADETIAILAQQPETGVFGNKGIDAIKEAGLRLGEMSDATKEALKSIGLSGAEIQKQIQDGTITTFEAVQKISGKLDELPETSSKVATAVNGIFGGKGQDAGLKYLKGLKDININLDDLTGKAGEFATANLKIVDAQERINLLFNQVLGGDGNFFKVLKAGALDFVANALEFIINGTISLINYFRELYNQSILFRGIVQGIALGFQANWEAAKLFFNLILDGLKNAGAAIQAIFTGDFKAIPGILKKSLDDSVGNIKNFGTTLASKFKDAYNETLSPTELLKPISLTADEAVTAFYAAGLQSGAAFNDGVKLTRKQVLEDQKAFLETQLLQVEENSVAELKLKRQLVLVERDILLTEEGLTANQKLLIQATANANELEVQKDFLQKQKDLAVADLDKRIQDIEDGEERKSLILQQQLLNKEINEKTFNENLFSIREAALEAEIEQLETGGLAKLEKEVELEQLRADRVNEIKQKELETTNLIKQTELENNQARLDSAQTLAQGIIDVAGKASTAGKIAAQIARGLALTEIVFNLQKEISANNVAGAKISAMDPPYTIPEGVAYSTTRNVLAGISAGVGIAKLVTQFADGGEVSENIAFSGGHIPRYGGMIRGLPHGQGGVKFNIGNSIGEADGRKGEAYIVNTRKNPMLKAMASAVNVAGGGKGFFDMGGVIQYAQGGITGVSASNLLPSSNYDLVDIIENLPPPVVLVDDIYNGISRKTEIEDGAIL